MIQAIFRWLKLAGIDDLIAIRVARYGSIALVVLLAVLSFYVARRLMRTFLTRLVVQSETTLDDFLLQRHFFARVAYLAPALVVFLLAPFALEGFLFNDWREITDTAVLIYVIIILVLIFDSVLSAVLDVGRTSERLREIPLASFVQVLKLGVYFLGLLLLVSVFLGRSPLYLLSGLGAVTAVLSFVYQDALRGFVAGLQLTATRMVARGDWIEMPSYNVNGTVDEVGLTTIKISNFDQSITTVPTYDLIRSPYKNWRSMLTSSGRRVVRALYLDGTGIAFCTAEMLAQWRPLPYMDDIIDPLLAALKRGARPTNAAVFRQYVEAYLRHHPRVNKEALLMVHQLEPTAVGVPLQLIFFTPEKTDEYMVVQSEIFEHLLAMVPYFQLALFQNPTGQDVRVNPPPELRPWVDVADVDKHDKHNGEGDDSEVEAG